MANYDRRFLVPYLQDVCSVEMLCSKLQREINRCNANIDNLTYEIDTAIIVEPKYPQRSDFRTDGDTMANSIVPSLIFFLTPIIIAITVFSKIGREGLGLIIVLALVAIFLGGPWVLDIIGFVTENNAHYKKCLASYSENMEDYRRRKAALAEKRAEIQKIKIQIDVLRQHLSSAKKLREQVYSVNVIPYDYRSLHVAYYLHRHFSTSQETDLEKVLQTMLLNDIVKRLDKIISQNEEGLLNQRIQIAMQEQANRTMVENHREEMAKIAKMEANQQLQIGYQQMLIENQRVTNFFLAADYLRKK